MSNKSITGGNNYFPPGISSDAEPVDYKQQAANTKEIRAKIDAQSRAVHDSLKSRGNDSSLDIMATVTNPVANQNVVTFTPLSGSIAAITRLSICFSNPFLAMIGFVGWRILVTGAQPPYVTPFQFSGFGDIFTPAVIDTLWLQSNDTFALEIQLSAGFDEHLVVIGRIAGHVYKPASPQLVGEHY